MNSANYNKLFEEGANDNPIMETLMGKDIDANNKEEVLKNQTPMSTEKIASIKSYVSELRKKGMTNRNIKRKVKKKFNIIEY